MPRQNGADIIRLMKEITFTQLNSREAFEQLVSHASDYSHSYFIYITFLSTFLIAAYVCLSAVVEKAKWTKKSEVTKKKSG